MLIKDITSCSTIAVRGLDNQLIYQMNLIRPNLLERIDDLNVQLGEAVHPWLQSKAKGGLKKAIAYRKRTLIINSAYRTIAGQALLREHYERKRCNIIAAALPGQSNHNNASAIDVEDAYGWEPYLEKHGWHKLGDFDPMHYDCLGCGDISDISILAFQQLWNFCRPKDRIAEDGGMGPATLSRLRYAPAEGFPGVEGCPRLLRLTEPYQVGDDVGALQLALKKAGIVSFKADKVFGPSTAAAIVQFQKSRALLADGVPGTTTLKALGLA
jgi:N-acetylmuramoyl-L-alanine amidase